MNDWAQSAAKMGAIGYNTYGNGGFIAYYCLKHQYSTSLPACPICRGIPNGFAGIPYKTMGMLYRACRRPCCNLR